MTCYYFILNHISNKDDTIILLLVFESNDF